MKDYKEGLSRTLGVTNNKLTIHLMKKRMLEQYESNLLNIGLTNKSTSANKIKNSKTITANDIALLNDKIQSSVQYVAMRDHWREIIYKKKTSLLIDERMNMKQDELKQKEHELKMMEGKNKCMQMWISFKLAVKRKIRLNIPPENIISFRNPVK